MASVVAWERKPSCSCSHCLCQPPFVLPSTWHGGSPFGTCLDWRYSELWVSSSLWCGRLQLQNFPPRNRSLVAHSSCWLSSLYASALQGADLKRRLGLYIYLSWQHLLSWGWSAQLLRPRQISHTSWLHRYSLPALWSMAMTAKVVAETVVSLHWQ